MVFEIAQDGGKGRGGLLRPFFWYIYMQLKLWNKQLGDPMFPCKYRFI
jgi:hypothetical protein